MASIDVSSPSEKRTDRAARSASNMAVMTGDGSMVPALHALPLETLTPSRSSAATSSGPCHRENATFVTWGARIASAPFTSASGSMLRSPSSSLARTSAHAV